MIDVLSLIGAVMAGGVLIWLAFRIEPHWCSKDGTRFTCRLQGLTTDGANEGLHVEMRVSVVGDDLVMTPRGLRGMRMGGTYRLLASSPEPPPKRRIYLASHDGKQWVVRVPASSRCVSVLDEIVARTVTGGASSPRTAPTVPPSDPD